MASIITAKSKSQRDGMVDSETKKKHDAIQAIIDSAFKAGSYPYPSSIAMLAAIKASATPLLLPSDYSLTRDQAIKRIKDIQKGVQNKHISDDCLAKGYLLNDCERGAVNELMAIFDIKESEL